MISIFNLELISLNIIGGLIIVEFEDCLMVLIN